jgi:glycosyltransferase involved in cell wall biosynthesis
MKSIAWQTRSSLLYHSMTKMTLDAKANGGNAYDFQVARALSSSFKVIPDLTSVYNNQDSPISYWWRMRNYSPKATCRVLEPYPIVFGGNFKSYFNVAMIHHIDTNADTGSIKYRWFYKRLFQRIKKFDKVVTVSNFWKDYLYKKGCDNVEVISNSFAPENYHFDDDTLEITKQKYEFDPYKPLIYIGNASHDKGVHQVYEALKNSGYQLVMTGATNRASDIPVKFFNLPASDYRKLIASCDAVITMSGMLEGWNRVAHEAMLCKVPVIGSGSGGMRELLEGGKQQMTTNYKDIPVMIETALSKKKQYGVDGFNFVSKFDETYFKESWNKIIE